MKGETMSKKAALKLVMWAIPIFLGVAMGNAWAQVKVGDEAPSFTLPTSQGKLADYYKDYYGKHHLIMTFFPAAFTPV
jgi:peroxiredoxin